MSMLSKNASTASSNRSDTAYGSPPSRGRHVERFALESLVPRTHVALKQQRLGLLHLRQRLHLGQHIRRHRAVDLDQRDGVAALLVAAEMEGGDVDPGIAEQARGTADEAGLCLRGVGSHRLAEFGIDPDALDVDQARLAVGIDRAGYRTLLTFGGDGERDQA